MIGDSKSLVTMGAMGRLRQIDGLALAVQEVLLLDPFSSHLFAFTNRRKKRVTLCDSPIRFQVV